MGAINTGRKFFSYPNNGLYQGNKKMKSITSNVRTVGVLQQMEH